MLLKCMLHTHFGTRCSIIIFTCHCCCYQYSYSRLLSAQTPGNFFPCINYNEAPPFAEMKLTSLLAPLLFTSFAVSLPPITEITPSLVLSITLFSKFSLPFLKLYIQKMPIGPFQKIEFARLTTESKYSAVFGPLSNIFQPSGIYLFQ